MSALNIKTVISKLEVIGDSPILSQDARDASTDAARIITELRKALDLDATVTADEVIRATWQRVGKP